MYEFDGLPLEPVEPSTNVMIAGSGMSGAESLFLRMITPADREGTILVAAGTNARKLYERLDDASGPIDKSAVGMVDAVSQQQGVTADAANLRTVSSPRDLTGIGMELTDLYEALYRQGRKRVRTGLDSVSTLLMYGELPTVFRFLHVFTGRVSTADGLGVFVIDPDSHDEQTTQTLSQLFDGRIDVRDQNGTRQLRVRGLADQPTDWTDF